MQERDSPGAGPCQSDRSSATDFCVRACVRCGRAGYEVCPKDLRSSFVTWVKNEHHTNETLQSAASAMRHSTAMQASEAYDKGKQDRVVAAATEVAERFAAQFQPVRGGADG